MDQIFGWHLEAAAAVGTQHAGTPEHRARALARWRDLPRFVDVEIANLREGLRLGYTAPRENVLRVIEQVDGALPADPAASPFHRLAERDSSPEFRAAWSEVVTGDVYPAMRRYLEFLRAEYLPAARVEPGLAALPDGLACYRAVVRGYTSVDVTPEEMRDAARAARAGMEAELAPIVRALTGEADAAEARRRLRTDPAWAYGSREAKLEVTRAQVEALRAQVPRAFSRVPETPLVVEPAPAFRERSSPPAWYDPAPLDGSRPGTYWTNLHDAERAPRMDLASSTTHEGWPGHHLQVAWVREREVPHPVMRLLSTGAYVEGWGMYAERVAFEEGMFDDPLMDAGVLSHLADALLGLEVDPGIHAFGWTREQAVDSMMAISGRPRSSAEAYADRHAATPGQIVTYMVGYLEIMRLRDEARRTLGDRFDLRAFHDVVLDEGPMPLGMLRARVERWVEERRGADAG